MHARVLADLSSRVKAYRAEVYIGGCQNYGPFLGPYYIIVRHLMFRVPQKGAIIFDNYPCSIAYNMC